MASSTYKERQKQKKRKLSCSHCYPMRVWKGTTDAGCNTGGRASLDRGHCLNKAKPKAKCASGAEASASHTETSWASFLSYPSASFLGQLHACLLISHDLSSIILCVINSRRRWKLCYALSFASAPYAVIWTEKSNRCGRLSYCRTSQGRVCGGRWSSPFGYLTVDSVVVLAVVGVSAMQRKDSSPPVQLACRHASSQSEDDQGARVTK